MTAAAEISTAPDDTVPPEPPPPSDPPGAARPTGRRLALETAGVAGLAWVWIAIVLRIWDAPLRLPIDTRSDATLISMMVKNMQEQGWYLNQPRLGAPFGQQFYDFPHGGESFQLFAMKLLVVITGDWGLAINLYYLIGFGVLAAVTFLVLRHLRFGPVVAGVAALIFTFLPYHFVHAQMHLWRSTYYSAPLGALLLVWCFAWRDRFLVDPDRTGPGTIRGNLRWPRVAGAAAIAVVIGGTETMTTGFTMSLLAAGAVVSAIRWREPARLLVAVSLIAIMGATFAVLSYPTLNFYRVHGTNEEAARRLVTESELYSLKISRMITPQGGHRFEPFSDLGTRAQDRSPVRSEGGQALGILGTAGFFGALYGAFGGRRRLRGETPDTRPASDRDTLLEQSTSTTILALLFGSVGGLAVILALMGFAQIRVWNRIFLFVAFFAMVMVARWAEHLAAWVHRRSARPRPILGAVAVGVLVFGIWDGIPPQRESYAAIEARHANDRDFVGRIEQAMPDGTAILQLPIVPFPEEPPPGKMLDYDHLRAFLADDGSSLEWSYGSIRGRPDSRWQMHLRDQVGPVGALPALLGLGFTGIWIDTYGYTDGGAEARQIQEAVGVEPMVSSDGRFLFFDLRPYRESLDETDEELRQAARDLLLVEPPAAPS